MNNTQTIIFTTFATLAIIAFSGSVLAKTDDKKMAFSTLAFFISGFLWVSLFVTVKMLDDTTEKAKGKCPEFVKLENVYQINPQ